MARVHIIGAGLAGLSAAVDLAGEGWQVSLYEAADKAGGRCRSYFDKHLGKRIDNGNHLMLSANNSALDYMSCIGSSESLLQLSEARFPFLDLQSMEQWELRPGGPLPFWLFDRRRRVAGTSLKEYLAAASLALAGPDETVADALSDRGPLWHRFWVPLTVAALNTPPAEASAELLWSLMKGTFLKGAQACRPLIAKDSLAESLINPAVTYLESKGAELHLNCRLRQIRTEMNRVAELNMAHRPIPVTAEERVILALPPLALKAFLPHLDIPQEVSAIVNAHYLLPGEPGPNCALTRRLPFLGMVGGTADWLFLREDVASITVSAADDLAAHENKGIAEALWHDTAKALDMAEKPLPPHRILKEKRATFRQTPEALKCRPGPDIGFANLFISGDWTDTGFPATIESAIKSGKIAASKCKVTLS